MSVMQTWRNGEKGEKVHSIIQDNFAVLSKHLGSIVMALSTSERVNLDPAYLSNKLVVYDTTDNRWYQYNNGSWSTDVINFDTYKGEFYITSGSWTSGTFTIPFSAHGVTNPVVQIYIYDSTYGYTQAFCDVSVDPLDNTIVIRSDIAFNGRVVIV